MRMGECPACPVRLVKLVGIYARINKRGKGVGFICLQLRDARTEEVLHQVSRPGSSRFLVRFADKHGYKFKTDEPDAT